MALENKVQIIPVIFIPDRKEIFLFIKAKSKMWKKKKWDVDSARISNISASGEKNARGEEMYLAPMFMSSNINFEK